LFITFINDLPEVCKEINNIFLYADDAKLFRHVKTQFDNLIQKSIKNVGKIAVGIIAKDYQNFSADPYRL